MKYLKWLEMHDVVKDEIREIRAYQHKLKDMLYDGKISKRTFDGMYEAKRIEKLAIQRLERKLHELEVIDVEA